MANEKRRIEIFSADCPVCQSVIERIRSEACPSCDIQVLDMDAPDTRRRAADLGISSVPSVVIDGRIADCCASRGVDVAVLRAAGLGRPIT